MALGKPVVATQWSGPADYLTDDNSYAVGYRLVELGKTHGPYAADQVWAEPDLADAARAMRSIHASPPAAASVGQRGRSDILGRYSAKAVAPIISERLSAIPIHRMQEIA